MEPFNSFFELKTLEGAHLEIMSEVYFHQGSICERAWCLPVMGLRTSPPETLSPAPSGPLCQRAHQRLRFRVTGLRTSPTCRPGPAPSGSPMSKGLLEAPFLSNGHTNITYGTAQSSPIRVPYVNGPAEVSVFELRANKRHQRDGPVQPHYGPHVKSLMEAPFLCYKPTNITNGTTLSNSIRVPYVNGLREALFSSYGPTIVTTGTAQSSGISVPDVIGPDRGSVFDLRAHEHHHQDHPVQPQQGPLCQRARQRLRFRVTGPRTSPSGPPGLASSGYKAWQYPSFQHPFLRLQFTRLDPVL